MDTRSIKRTAEIAGFSQKSQSLTSLSSVTNTSKEFANLNAIRAAKFSRKNNNGGRKNRKYTHFDNAQYDEQGNIVHQFTSNTRVNSTESIMQDEEMAQQQAQVKEAIKPLIVETNYQVMLATINVLTFKEKPTFKIIGRNTKVLVQCANTEDKAMLSESLKNKQFQFYSYTEPAAKTKYYVLKGFWAESDQAVLKQLKDAGVPATKVTVLNPKIPESPIYMIHFLPTQKINLKLLQTIHKYINECSVRWEFFDLANKKPTQCFNCQRYGHAASNCNMNFRCIKCDMKTPHGPGECPRVNREEGAPKCCNCGGDHPANSSICQHHITYRRKIEKKRVSRDAAAKFVDNLTSPWTANNHRQLRQPAQQRLLAQGRGTSSAASWAAMAAAPASSSQFPNLQQTQGQNNNTNVSTNMSGIESMQSIFTSIKEDLAAVPTLLQELQEFKRFTASVRSAQSAQERKEIMLAFFLPTQNVC